MIDKELLIVSPDVKISEVFKKIQENKHGCIFICDLEDKIIGLATDGDIRRYLINNDNLSAPIGECMNKSFTKASVGSSREYILKLLDHRVSIIPIIDSTGKLVDFVSKKQFPLEKESNIVVRSKSPVRISFGGGGTDLTHYFVKNEIGAVLNCTLKIYSHCTLKKRDDGKSSIDSADLNERVEFVNIDELDQYPKFILISSVLKLIKPNFNFDLFIHSDFPVGSGLGGSAVVLSSVIGCFNQFKEDPWDNHEIAELAFQAERIYLNMAGGWQDQYATVFGGFNFMEFKEKENIVHPLKISKTTLLELEENLLLCNTNITHVSSSIHDDQKEAFKSSANIQDLVHQNRTLTYEMKAQLLRGSLVQFGKSLHKAWVLKKGFSSKISTSDLDLIYDKAINNGAIGGKLLGAGGGGFFLFYVDPIKRKNVENSLKELGLNVHPVIFDEDGLQAWKIRDLIN